MSAYTVMHACATDLDSLAAELAATLLGAPPHSILRRIALVRETAAGLRAAAKSYHHATLCDLEIEGCGTAWAEPTDLEGG